MTTKIPPRLQSSIEIGSAVTMSTGSPTRVPFALPAQAKRVTLIFDSVSSSGTGILALRLSTSGSDETSGYDASGMVLSSTPTVTNAPLITTHASLVGASSAPALWSGEVTLTNMGGNKWSVKGTLRVLGASSQWGISHCIKTLAGSIDGVSLMFTNGTDTFDGGTVTPVIEF